MDGGVLVELLSDEKLVRHVQRHVKLIFSAFFGCRKRWMRMLSVSCGWSFASSLVSTRVSSVEGQAGLAPDLADLFARTRPGPFDFEFSIIPPSKKKIRTSKKCGEVDGLLLGAQLAVDTTLVSVSRRNGVPRPRCANVDGAALEAARRVKERRYPELSGRHGRTRLVVLGAEIGGRWSEETGHFLRHAFSAKVQQH